MFVGHYAAALAAKGLEPRAPLWTYVAGAQLIDIGWSALIMAGVERMHVDPTLPGSDLVLEHMPYTHSLPASLIWAIGAVVLARLVLKLNWAAAAMIGAVVFSHWLTDLLVHRPDLELWFGGQKVGLGLWNYPLPEQAVEMGLLGMGGALWAWQRGRSDGGAWAVPLFLGVLMALQITAMILPRGTDPVATGGSALAVYLVVTALAVLVDRKRA